MRTKAALSGMAIILLLGVFVACAVSAPKKSEVESYIKESAGSFLSTTEEIDKVEITEQESEKDPDLEKYYFTVTSHDEEVSYVRYFIMQYRYEDKEWRADGYTPIQQEQWSTTPLRGVMDETIENTVMTRVRDSFTLDGDVWPLSGDTVDRVEIDEHTPQLEQGKDAAIVTVVMKSDVMLAEGQLQLNFYFDGGWIYEDYSVVSQFTTSYIPGTELEPTDNDLLSAISTNQLIFGERATEQTISISENEVSDFVITNNTTENRGTCQTFDCKFNLDKGIATFEVEAQVEYIYYVGGGWQIENITSAGNVTSVDIMGKWVGTCGAQYYGGNLFSNDYPQLVFEVTEVTRDGTIPHVMLNFTSPTYSCSATGYIDYKNLGFTITFENWIEEPSSTLRGYDALRDHAQLQPDLVGCIFVEDAAIKNTTGREFEVTKE